MIGVRQTVENPDKQEARPMTRRAKRLTVLLVAVTMLVGVVANTAWGKATETPVYGEITGSSEPTTEKAWIDDDGIGHFRGYRADEYIENGNLAGVIHVVIDQNVNMATGDGDMHGSIVWESDDPTVKGTFEGRFDGTTTYPGSGPYLYFDGYWVLHGTGEFEGQKMQTHNYGTLPQVCEGYILDPHGE
jgi:hypothetical protein